MDRDQAIDRLYELPLEEFVAERNRLAKELRGDGMRDEAADVAKLKKPSRAAWAINRAVRERPELATQLLDASGALADAQEAAVSGSGRGALDDAIAEERAAIEEATAAARAQLEGGGAVVDRVRNTLRAVPGDPELRAELESGRVITDREAMGFGAAPLSAAGRTKPKARPKRVRAGPGAKKRGGVNAKKDAGLTRKELADARRRADRARRRRASAERALERSRERLANARELVEATEGEVAERTEELAGCQEEFEAAEAALTELDGSR